MSFNKKIDKFERKKRNISPKKLDGLKSHISADEINSDPLIKDILKKIRKIKLNVLTKLKPQLTPIKDIKNEKQLKFIGNLNSFRQKFYDYNKSQKFPKNNEVIKVYKGEKNYNFSKIYSRVKENENLGGKEMLEEIQDLYKNNDYCLPSIEKNLFNKNLLLLNETNIKNSITYKLNSEKNNKNSLSFLKKMHKNINNQIVGKDQPQLSNMHNNSIDIQEKSSLQNDLIQTNDAKNESIYQSKMDINNTKETINNIDDLDYFFESNNKNYFNYLKNKDSIKNSKVSTRVNSAIWLANPKNNENNNIDIYNLKVKKKKFNSVDIAKLKKSVLEICNKNKINNNINIYNLDSNSNLHKEKIYKNNSMDNIIAKNNLIKLKKLYLNGKIKILNSNKKFVNLEIQTNNDTLTKSNKRLSINVQKPDTFDQLINLFPKKLRLRGSMPLFKSTKYNNLNNSSSKLEKLYEKIKNKDDLLEYNDSIKEYLKGRRYNIEPKISPIDICYHYQNMRKNIIRNDILKKNMKLKKFSGLNEQTSENIKKGYHNYLTKLKSMGDNINKMIPNL